MKKLKLLIILCILGTSLLFSTNVLAFQVNDNQVVYTNKKWMLEFTGPVGYDDLTKQAIIVTDSKGAKASISLQLGNDNKSIIVYPPAGGYIAGESYTLKVGKQVHSSKGTQMKQDRLIHFSIEKISKIEITSTSLLSIDGGTTGKINYKVLDQDGNDITKSTTANNLTFQSGVGTAKGSNGVITIASPFISLNTLKSVQITILDSNNGAYASGIYNVESFEVK
ncbi:hypothetical protein HBE96_21500 [Clostridium sp. P21]|uniref:SbsA Ig-like domain-containing protein n=1 Tax=Clostridium muellerianum TaxID=2716538 RepID=A0A7Y0HRS6_9CLOT|nr:hypothetical protein [Clostridium muellerianum]NMM65163.1 hypothetical protein [Clostridium muellerianum]